MWSPYLFGTVNFRFYAWSLCMPMYSLICAVFANYSFHAHTKLLTKLVWPRTLNRNHACLVLGQTHSVSEIGSTQHPRSQVKKSICILNRLALCYEDPKWGYFDKLALGALVFPFKGGTLQFFTICTSTWLAVRQIFWIYEAQVPERLYVFSCRRYQKGHLS